MWPQNRTHPAGHTQCFSARSGRFMSPCHHRKSQNATETRGEGEKTVGASGAHHHLIVLLQSRQDLQSPSVTESWPFYHCTALSAESSWAQTETGPRRKSVLFQQKLESLSFSFLVSDLFLKGEHSTRHELLSLVAVADSVVSGGLQVTNECLPLCIFSNLHIYLSFSSFTWQQVCLSPHSVTFYLWVCPQGSSSECFLKNLKSTKCLQYKTLSRFDVSLPYVCF